MNLHIACAAESRLDQHRQETGVGLGGGGRHGSITAEKRIIRQDPGPHMGGSGSGPHSKKRIRMLGKLAEMIVKLPPTKRLTSHRLKLRDSKLVTSLVSDLGIDIDEIMNLAYSIRPNVASLIVEIERVKTSLRRQPTMDDIIEHSRHELHTFEMEFGTLGGVMETLGQGEALPSRGSANIQKNRTLDDWQDDIHETEDEILGALEGMPVMQDVFSRLKVDLPKCGKQAIQGAIDRLNG
ncbi:MAG: hypothetical protein MPJ53_02140 [Alphaproteobacteria bacterium]|nr:hypothetical protein [Alphaproteobacteria bacterium]MDA7989651.1 hypothetical protein [Gammaproteobacteria bacterium]